MPRPTGIGRSGLVCTQTTAALAKSYIAELATRRRMLLLRGAMLPSNATSAFWPSGMNLPHVIQGKILAARRVRDRRIAHIDICLGMQVAKIEYARHMAGLAGANSTEFEPDTPDPVIALIDEWHDRDGTIQRRDANSDLGGTMRLRAQSSDVGPGTVAHGIYGDVVTEHHRHRYEANERYLQRLRDAGLVISALTQREKLTEIIELSPAVHPWIVGVQFHPDFKSTPWGGHRCARRSWPWRSATAARCALRISSARPDAGCRPGRDRAACPMGSTSSHRWRRRWSWSRPSGERS